MSRKSKFKVAFEPSSKMALVPKGTLLLDAAAVAGLTIDTPCGGQGRCGRCLLRVGKGEVLHPDNPHLGAEQAKEGWVLSCQARVAEDTVLHVPASRELEEMAVRIRPSKLSPPLSCDLPFEAVTHRVFLELPPPTLSDSASDLDRLQKALNGRVSRNHISISLPLMRSLAGSLRSFNWQVTATVHLPNDSGVGELIDLAPGRITTPLLGAAIDIGTTNVVGELVDLRSGKVLGIASARNQQVLRGEDVISRIIYSQRPGGLKELQGLAAETVNKVLSELGQQQNRSTSEIQELVVAGNTTMTHLFLGLSPRHIREEPYVPTASHLPVVRGGELGLATNALAPVYVMPCVAAYVGGDITAGVLSSCLFKTDKLTLFLDIGTNGEIVLGNSDWMMTSACSAGPAFEGAGVQHGMRAIRGAIQEVRINSKTLEPTIRVIGEVAPQGICGSGMISALAEMLVSGVVNRAGHIDRSKIGKTTRIRLGKNGAEYVLAWTEESANGEDIVLTDVDLNNLVRTKAAIYAATTLMLKRVGIQASDIEEVLIGGAFGQHINVEQAIQIGLLPDLPWDRFQFLGNTSLAGAYNALVSCQGRGLAEDIADRLTYLELIADSAFMDEFTAALFLPHTRISEFASVQALEPGRTRQRGLQRLGTWKEDT